ncbi:hypothetical protein [Streptomyces sp. NPDC097619]|uniref:hypothetical protein n=1 Tax=Streptomyces sp. NPDC097619 TaxID=3157228 RepID=UPI00331C1DB6
MNCDCGTDYLDTVKHVLFHGPKVVASEGHLFGAGGEPCTHWVLPPGAEPAAGEQDEARRIPEQEVTELLEALAMIEQDVLHHPVSVHLRGDRYTVVRTSEEEVRGVRTVGFVFTGKVSAEEGETSVVFGACVKSLGPSGYIALTLGEEGHDYTAQETAAAAVTLVTALEPT